MAGTGFGLNTPFNAPIPSSIPWGLSPHSGISVNPFMVPQLTGSSVLPFQQGNVFNPYATVPLQQIQQLLQIVPQQLQQIQTLQQQQLIYLQQLLQIVPAQLQQLHQIVQSLPLQPSSIQPFGQSLSGPLGFGPIPQPFPGQLSSHVM